MQHTTRHDEPGVGLGVLGAMWRHRLIVIGTITVAVAAGVAITMLQPESYVASARVFMTDPRAEGVFSTDPAGDDARRQQNRVERFRSEPVLIQAAATVGTSMQLSELRSAVDVVPAAVADEITVTVRSGDPTLARDLANAVVAAYREQYRVETVAHAERTITALDQELAALQQELEEIEVELAPYLEASEGAEAAGEATDTPSPASHLTILNVRRDAQVTLIRETLVARGAVLIEAQAAEDVARVEAATTPSAPSPDQFLVISLSVVVGLVAAALLAVWQDERVRARTRHAAAARMGPTAADDGMGPVAVTRSVMAPPRSPRP